MDGHLPRPRDHGVRDGIQFPGRRAPRHPGSALGEPLNSARPGRAAAVFALSASGLLAELAWTRIAGLLFFGDSAYLVVSLAVAGLSLGAALGALRPALLRVGAAPAAAASGLFVLVGVSATLALAGRGGVAAALALSVPGFVALGLAVAGLFAGAPRTAPTLYRADLLGAAAGAALSLPLLGRLGAPDAALVAAALASAAGFGLSRGKDSRRGRPTAGGVSMAAVVVIAAAVAGVATPWPRSDASSWATPKPLAAELARGGRIAASSWGTLGRSDLLVRADGAEILYLDGGAGSLVPTADSASLWRRDPGRFPFEALRPERVFVVGGGGGLEVAHALERGVGRIVAAEVNGAGLALARRRLAADGGVDVFDDPRVRWHRDEARSALAAEDGAFDLITLSQAVTQTAEARRLALTENGLYTLEAVASYLERLAPAGAVAFELYDELTLTRVLTTSVRALTTRGTSEAAAMGHLFAVLDATTSPPTPLLMAFAEPLERARAIALARAAEGAGLRLLHVPGLLENPPLDGVAAGTTSLAAVVAAADDVDLSPTTDDAPFFWSFEPGVPPALERLLTILGVASFLAGVLVLVGVRRGPSGARRATFQVALLGVAFLAVELAVLSRTQLLLGHPAAALALTLGGLLAGGGIGSGLARRLDDAWPAAARAAVVAAAAAAAWTLAWPSIAGAVAEAPAWGRALAVLASVLPLGLALGMPFPLALRRIGRTGPVGVARAWSANGLGSLLGAAGATAVAHLAGFSVVAACAALLYLAAAAIAAALPGDEGSA